MNEDQFWQSPGELESLVPNYKQEIDRLTKPIDHIKSINSGNDVIRRHHDLNMDALLDSNKPTKQLKITINQYENVEDHVSYKIEVQKDDFTWLVLRRYSEFYKLHEELVEKYSISWRLLPSKKVIGNRKLSLLMSRMSLLEKYLQGIVGLWDELPRVLVEFLELDQFDVISVCRTLARDLWEIGDTLLRKKSTFKVTPHQVYCINRRLHLPSPTTGSGDPAEDIGHLYSFIHQVKNILIYPGEERQFYMKNGDFTYDLTTFKSLQYLETQRIDTEGLCGIEAIQRTVKEIKACRSLQLVKDLLISNERWSHGLLIAVDSNQEKVLDVTKQFPTWNFVEKACFSHNSLKFIDYSILLLPNLRILDLSHNLLSSLQFLEELTFLEELDLSYNEIESVKDFSLLVPSVSKLNVAGNILHNVKGLERMFSLQYLDVSNNLIDQVEETLPLGQLPLIKELRVQGNPFTSTCNNYRTLLLAQFGIQSIEIILDGKQPSSKEKKKIASDVAALESYVVISNEEFEERLEQTNDHRRSISQQKNKKVRRSDDIEKQTTSPRPRKKVVDINPPRSQNKDRRQSIEEKEEREFRSQVEKLQHAGGDDWLSLYNDTIKENQQTEEKPNKINPIETKEETDTKQKKKLSNLQQNSSKEKTPKKKDQTNKTIGSNDIIIHEPIKTCVTNLTPEKGKPNFQRTLSNEEIDLELNEVMRNAVREILDSGKQLSDETFLFTNLKEGKEVMWALSDHTLLEIVLDTGIMKSKYILKTVRGLKVSCGDDQYMFQFEAEPFIAGNEEPMYELVKISTPVVKDAAGFYTLLKPHNTGGLMNFDKQQNDTARLDSQVTPDEISSFIKTFLNETNKASMLQDSGNKPSSSLADNSNYANINIGHSFYRHQQENQSSFNIKQSLYTGCVPYLFSDEEIPTYVIVTELNIFLLRAIHSDGMFSDVIKTSSLAVSNTSLTCFYSFSLKNVKEVVIGLFDQTIRIESRDEGPRGTFLFLTRDMMKTGKLVDAIRCQCEKLSHEFSLVYPTENHISALSWQLEQQEMVPLGSRENLMSYYIVYELTQSGGDTYEGSTVPNLRSLILTNRRLLLCDEDYVHWPLPSFVRTPPLTPQWIIIDKYDVEALIGVDIWKDDKKNDKGGNYGITLNFECRSNVRIISGNLWKLLFSSINERDQFVRSLACLWKNSFDQDLQITQSNILSNFLSLPKQLSVSNLDIGSDHFETPESLIAMDQHQINLMFRHKIAVGADKELPNIHFMTSIYCVPFNFPDVEIKVVLLLSNENIYIAFANQYQKYFENFYAIDEKNDKCLYFISISIRSLHGLVVGLFDQCFRLETNSPSQTFVCVTRNGDVTNDFMQRLSQVILNLPIEGASSVNFTPTNRSATKIFQMYRMEDNAISEFTHPNSNIQFTYPNDDTLEKLKYEISEHLKNNNILSAVNNEFSILLYAFIYQTTSEYELNNTFVISEKFLCLIKEDNVNYPLAHFVKERPISKQYQVISAQLMVSLMNIEFHDFHSGIFTLTFNSKAVDPSYYEERFHTKSVDSDDACLVTDVNQHTSIKTSERDIVKWNLRASSREEREKILNILSRVWNMLFPDKELSITTH